MKKNQNGYALLASVVIIATVLLMMAITGARRVQDGFFSSIGVEHHLKAHYLAEGCMDVAFLKIARDDTYAGNEVITIAGDDCTIRPVVGNILEVEASDGNYWYRIRATMTSFDPLEVSTWERVSGF